MTTAELKEKIIATTKEQRRLFNANADIYLRLANHQFEGQKEMLTLSTDLSRNLVAIEKVHDELDTYLAALDAQEKANAQGTTTQTA